MARKVVLWRRNDEPIRKRAPDPALVRKIARELEGDGLSTDDRTMIAELIAAGPPDDPDTIALAKATIAEMAPSPRVEIRKNSAGAKPVTESFEELEARRHTSEANIAALEAREMVRKGGREGAVKANEIFGRDPDAYAAYQALERGERWQAPVVKAEKDYREEIRRLLRAHDHKALRELLEKNPEASRQYRRLVMAGKGF